MRSEKGHGRRLALSGGLLVLAGLAGGCGADAKSEPPNAFHAIKGKVKLEVPGSLANLRIAFIQDGPGARTARGDVKADGSFQLTTNTPDDGVAEGNYKVHFEKVAIPGKDPKSIAVTIPAVFLDEDASDLKATVGPDTTELLVVVKPVKAAAGSDRSAR